MQANLINKKVDLNEIALKLLANEAIANQVTDTGLVFTANQLAKKLPFLKALGDMPLIALRKDERGNLGYVIPTLYSDGDKFAVCLPDLNRSVTNKFEIQSWQIGDISSSTLRAKDLSIKGAIAVTKEILDDVRCEYDGQLEGQGTDTLKSLWLKQKPQIELPLRSLPIGEAFEIIGKEEKRSRKYSTPMVDLKDSSGSEYDNVITNSALRNLIDSGCQQFMIKEIIEVKKDKTRTDKVLLTPLDGADFSDFAII